MHEFKIALIPFKEEFIECVKNIVEIAKKEKIISDGELTIITKNNIVVKDTKNVFSLKVDVPETDYYCKIEDNSDFNIVATAIVLAGINFGNIYNACNDEDLVIVNKSSSLCEESMRLMGKDLLIKLKYVYSLLEEHGYFKLNNEELIKFKAIPFSTFDLKPNIIDNIIKLIKIASDEQYSKFAKDYYWLFDSEEEFLDLFNSDLIITNDPYGFVIKVESERNNIDPDELLYNDYILSGYKDFINSNYKKSIFIDDDLCIIKNEKTKEFS